jgi:hypothetical protein
MAARPGQPDRLSCASQGRLGKRLLGSRRGSGSGSDRVWLLGARTDHGLRRARNYSYIVADSFPASQHAGGTLTCTPSGDGTHVDWVSAYTVPARGGGKVTEVLFAPLISLAFRAILAGCAKALES